LTLRERGVARPATDMQLWRAVKLLGVNTSPVHRHYEVSVHSQACVRYREMTVRQGEGCADLVRRAPPGHRAAAAQARPCPATSASLEPFTAPDSPHRLCGLVLSTHQMPSFRQLDTTLCRRCSCSALQPCFAPSRPGAQRGQQIMPRRASKWI
jgi:hypothetical protein